MSHRDVFLFTPSRHYVIRNDRTFYLDTSVIRRRGASLPKSPLAHSAYTSALAVVELLSRVRQSDRAFKIVRNALKALQSSDIPIDWRLPDAQIRGAFPAVRPKVDIYDTRAASLQALVRLVLEATSAEQLSSAAEKLDVPQDLGFFEEYDVTFGHDFMAAAAQARQNSLANFNPESNFAKAVAQVFELPPNFLHDDYIRALRGSKFNEGMSRWIIAEIVRNREGLPRHHQREFFMQYDNSIDAYMKGLAWSQFDQILGRTAGRNDAIDLAHLLYLFPESSLVTADRALANVAHAIGLSVFGPESIVAGA